MAYERLRWQVTATAVGGRLARAAGGGPAGLGLVLEQGVPGWLEALERLDAAACVPHGEPGSCHASSAAGRAAEEVVPVALQLDLTRLLASLVLSTRGSWVAEASVGPASRPSPAAGGGRWR